MTSVVPFPSDLPPGYQWFDDEPPFDPQRHLALEPPSGIVALTDLGYRPDELIDLPTEVAISSPFRILSDEGVQVMLDVARRLRPFGGNAGARIEHSTRGGCYRSRWLRDLSLSPDVSRLLSEIYRTEVSPHPMVSHLGHLNYEPAELSRPVDKWHHDTLPLDYVLMVTDPAGFEGGDFEYFVGTKAEAAELAAAGRLPPVERRVQPEFPGAGWAVALHGNMVVHRAQALTEVAERITMVNGYVATDARLPAQSRTRDLIGVDDEAFLYSDWARFVAWRAEARLADLATTMPHIGDRDRVIAELEHAVEDVQHAIAEMRAGQGPLEHYEHEVR